MKKNRIYLPILVLIFFSMQASVVFSAPIQRIREIQRPLLSVPAIVKAGEAFEMELKLGGKSVENVYLTGSADSTLSADLTISNPSDYKDIRMCRASVPGDTPEALYDLNVAFKDGSSDRQPHAVKVVAEFKKSYDFIHLTDIHFNVSRDRVPELGLIRTRLLEDIRARAPEFIIFSGDLMLFPETYDEDYSDSYEKFLEYLNAPVFMVPGNHEFYIDTRPDTPIDGAPYWEAAYGPAYHSFDYGGLHVVGINTFDWSDRWRDRFNPEVKGSGSTGMAFIGPRQWKWLRDDLVDAELAGKNIIAYTHVPIELLQGGRKIGITDPEKLKGPSFNQFVELLERFKVSYIFAGHLHVNSERRLGDVTEILTLGAGNGVNSKDMDKKWGYRIVHVTDSVITGTETHEIGFEDIE